MLSLIHIWYNPQALYNGNPHIHRAVDMLFKGFDGRSFADIATSLTTRDPYMVLADFEDYCRAQQASCLLYTSANFTGGLF